MSAIFSLKALAIIALLYLGGTVFLRSKIKSFGKVMFILATTFVIVNTYY